jgi:predicted NAD/FAD-binding protein
MGIPSTRSTPRRIAIIGGGVSGLSAAYFLDDVADLNVTLYESSARLGGHALTVQARTTDGKPYAVDPIAYLFIRQRYPFFTAWLKQLGVKTLPLSFENYLWDSQRQRGILFTSSLRKIFTTPGKSFAYFRDLNAFRKVIKAAGQMEKAGKLHDRMLMSEFVQRVPGIRPEFLREVFYPLMSFAFHCEPRSMPDQPCGAFMRAYASVAKDTKGAYCVEGGVSTYVEAVHRQLKRAQVILNATVTAVKRTGGDTPRWRVTTADGDMQEYDEVLLAIWPNQAADILRAGMRDEQVDAELKETVEVLSKVELAYSHATVHNDVAAMPANKRHWATYIYKRPLDEKKRRPGATIWSGQAKNASVFTTYDWNATEAGIADPDTWTRIGGPIHATNINFGTPPRPALYEARDHINARQGHQALWFTGCYLRETGFHEDGLVSTMDTVKNLVPDHTALVRMQKLLADVRVP